MAGLPEVQRIGDSVSDEIQCPECEGSGSHALAPSLRVKCGFCLGSGMVGGAHEPAEDPEPPPPPPAWRQPAIVQSGLCGYCLGAKEVTSLRRDADENPATLVTVPCPKCAG